MIEEHYRGRTGEEPVVIEKVSEIPATQAYYKCISDEVMEKVAREAKARGLAIIAYDNHMIEEMHNGRGLGSYYCKIVAFCYKVVLRTEF